MTGGLSPEQLGETAGRAAATGLLFGAIAIALLLALWALATGWRIETERRTRAAAQERAQAAVRAQQLDAGITAGWHDASPADRRRDR